MKLKDHLEFIKGIIRPLIVVWGLGVFTACVFTPFELPVIIEGLIGAVTVEYFGERAIKRIREL